MKSIIFYRLKSHLVTFGYTGKCTCLPRGSCILDGCNGLHPHPPTRLAHLFSSQMSEKGSLRFRVNPVECKKLWHKVAQFHICLAVTGPMRLRYGTAPVARSPEAVHRGRTWDHRAADLCMNHVLTSPRQTEPDVSRGDIRTGRHPLFHEAGGDAVSGDGWRPSWRNYIFWCCIHTSYLSVRAICHVKWGTWRKQKGQQPVEAKLNQMDSKIEPVTFLH